MADRPLSITLVSSHEQYGGAEALLDSLIERLGDVEVRAVLFLADGEFPDALRRRGLAVEIVALERGARRAAGLLRLRRVLRRAGADVVHANGTKAAILVALAALGTRLRIVWLKVDCVRDGWLTRLLALRCRAVVGISRTAVATFGANHRRVQVINPGIRRPVVDRGRGRDLVCRLLACPREAKVVVVSGRLSPHKGQGDLIDATPRLLAALPELRVALLGGETRDNPGYLEHLRARAEQLEVARSVSFLGHRPPGVADVDDVIRFVSGCDVLVAPSRHELASGWREGFGLAAAEAMWVGTPIVAYRHGALPEILGDCALFVPEGDVSALAAAIVELLGDPTIGARLARCGRERVAERYRWEHTVAALRQVYAEAARG